MENSPPVTLQGHIPPGTSAECGSTVGSLRVARLEQVAHRFGNNKLYISLNNKCFKVYPVYSLCTDVRPSQDHRILCMQTVRRNLAIVCVSEVSFLKTNCTPRSASDSQFQTLTVAYSRHQLPVSRKIIPFTFGLSDLSK